MDNETLYLLRVYVSETKKTMNGLVYEDIVNKAKDLGLSGATVLRGVMGFGSKHNVHTAKLLALSDDMPVVVEIVDSRENVDKIVSYLKESKIDDILITLEKVEVIK